LACRDTGDTPAFAHQAAVTGAVSLERLARAVRLEAVELDDEALVRPSEVGREGVDAFVDEWPGQFVGIEEGQEATFEVARGGRRDDPVVFDEPFEVGGSGRRG